MTELLIINSLIIWGVYTSLQEGMIFGRIGKWITSNKATCDGMKRNLPVLIQKPLATCPICMASVYGTPVFWYAYLTGLIQYDYIIIVYICYEFALAGLNYLILAFMPQNNE